jgi:hypothetical protein
MKSYSGVEVLLLAFLTSTLVSEWSASRPNRSTPGVKAPGVLQLGWIGSRGGLDAVVKRNPMSAPAVN